MTDSCIVLEIEVVYHLAGYRTSLIAWCKQLFLFNMTLYCSSPNVHCEELLCRMVDRSIHELVLKQSPYSIPERRL